MLETALSTEKNNALQYFIVTKNWSFIVKTMIDMYVLFSITRKEGIKCYWWAVGHLKCMIFFPIVHLVCLLKCNVSQFRILNRDQCGGLSCAGRALTACSSLSHTPMQTDTQTPSEWQERIDADKCRKSFAHKGGNTSNLSKHLAEVHHIQMEKCTVWPQSTSDTLY